MNLKINHINSQKKFDYIKNKFNIYSYKAKTLEDKLINL